MFSLDDFVEGPVVDQVKVLHFLAPRKQEVCIRCAEAIYSAEKADIGVALHKNCCRCAICNVTLTQGSYIIATPDDSQVKGVYCKAHAPRVEKFALDENCVEIRSAVAAQRINKKAHNFNKQVRVQDAAGWEYDPQAMEFEHAKLLHNRNRKKRSKHNELAPDIVEYEGGDILRKLKDGNIERDKVKDVVTSFSSLNLKSNDDDNSEGSEYITSGASWSSGSDLEFSGTGGGVLRFTARGSQASAESRRSSFEWMDHTAGSDNDKNSQVQEEAIYETLTTPSSDLDDHHLELVRPPRLPPRNNVGYRSSDFPSAYEPPTSWHTFNDCSTRKSNEGSRSQTGYENIDFGVGDGFSGAVGKSLVAQNELECRQRHEHGEMFRELARLREEQVKSLEMDLKRQMERAVGDVLYRIDSGKDYGDINHEKRKIEQHFQKLKQEEMRHLLDTLNGQERTRIDHMIDKQTHEMLQLIDKKVPKKLPSPHPPRKKKHELYPGPQVFDEIDFHAIQVAQRELGSFTHLIYELTRICRSQLEKARAIFRWITVKDLNQMIFAEELTEDNPYYFLKGIKYGLESYHEFFKRLCSYAGLSVKIIRGVSKSAGYRPGMPLQDGRFRNSWAVVYVEGEWRFLDSHWGARHVTNTRVGGEAAAAAGGGFCYELDEFFFLTDPEDHIFMHFPDDQEWQLLDRVVTLEQFIDFPVVKSYLFQYGLKVPPNIGSTIDSDNGSIEISLRRTSKTPLSFSYRLECDDELFDGYCIHHFQGSDVIFSVSLPKKGIYYFSIFACDTDQGDVYNNIVSFKIRCSHVDNKPFSRFPKLPHGYGPTDLASVLGMKTEKFSEYYLVCNEDKMVMNVHFKTPVKISHKLVCGAWGDENSDQLNRLVFHRNRDYSFVSFLIRFPMRAIYLFSIFAAPIESSSPVLECVGRYLIQCNTNPKSPVRPYPRTQQYWRRCRLHEPTSGDLKINKNVKFKIEVYKADAVAVIVGSQWYYLKQSEPGSKLWQGIAFTGRDSTASAEVYARFGSNKHDFFPLLMYKLADID